MLQFGKFLFRFVALKPYSAKGVIGAILEKPTLAFPQTSYSSNTPHMTPPKIQVSA